MQDGFSNWEEEEQNDVKTIHKTLRRSQKNGSFLATSNVYIWMASRKERKIRRKKRKKKELHLHDFLLHTYFHSWFAPRKCGSSFIIHYVNHNENLSFSLIFKHLFFFSHYKTLDPHVNIAVGDRIGCVNLSALGFEIWLERIVHSNSLCNKRREEKRERNEEKGNSPFHIEEKRKKKEEEILKSFHSPSMMRDRRCKWSICLWWDIAIDT